jgi:hypothetical protein
MTLTTEQQKLAYFHQRASEIKQQKLAIKREIIPGEIIITHGELVQALINGSATIKDENCTSALYLCDINWPELDERKRANCELLPQATDDYNKYDLELCAAITKIVDNVVLGETDPLVALYQIEQLP